MKKKIALYMGGANAMTAIWNIVSFADIGSPIFLVIAALNIFVAVFLGYHGFKKEV